MSRGTNRLNVRSVRTLAKPGLHADGDGLYLRVSPSGRKAWTFVYHMYGRRREMGLGSASLVSLLEARTLREDARRLVAAGTDPSKPQLGSGGDVTFGEATDALLVLLSPGWKNAKHQAQWRSTLERHCAAFWDVYVRDISTHDVMTALSPIWSKTPETAARLRGRIERVLDAAKVKGQREGDNPARWRGHLEILLPPMRKKSAVRHHPAMPYADVPSFVADLKGRLSMGARALEFLILTGGRTGEVLGMRWNEIDFEKLLWTVPKERMKAGIEHRVPLAPAAVTVLKAMEVFGMDPKGHVFRGQGNRPLSNMVMQMLMRRMGEERFTPHGFRSSFRDWVGEETDFPREIAEAALAHQVGSEVERAYRRGDALTKRRVLMNAWADHVVPAN